MLRTVLLFSGVYAATLAAAIGALDSHSFIAATVVAPLFTWLSIVDLNKHIIPDTASATVAAVGLILGWVERSQRLPLDIILAGGLLVGIWFVGGWYYRTRGQEAIGIGDAKLIAASTLLLGAIDIWPAIFLACGGGICSILITASLSGRNANGNNAVPFGPFIAYGVFLTFILARIQ